MRRCLLQLGLFCAALLSTVALPGAVGAAAEETTYTSARPNDVSTRLAGLNIGFVGIYHRLDGNPWSGLEDQRGGGITLDWLPRGWPLGFEFSYCTTQDERLHNVSCGLPFTTCQEISQASLMEGTAGVRTTWPLGEWSGVDHCLYAGGGAAFVRAELDSESTGGAADRDASWGVYVQGGYLFRTSLPRLVGATLFAGAGVRYTGATRLHMFGSRTTADGLQVLVTAGFGWR